MSLRRPIRVDNDVRIAMRDGIHLVADVIRPADADRHAAILVRSYGKADAARWPIALDLVQAGYAFISSDLRGRGLSEGEWHPDRSAAVEGPDGADTLEWIAAQAWCDGNVGMYGVSHAAYFNYRVAFEQPPDLRAIAPWTGGPAGGMFIPFRTRGVLSFLTTLVWLPNVAADAVDRLERDGHDVAHMRTTLQWARSNPEEFYSYLPFAQVPLAQFGRLRELLEFRLRRPTDAELEAGREYARVAVPAFHVAGWYDAVLSEEVFNFTSLREKAGSATAREGQHLVLGPWQHGSRFHSTLGALTFGPTASTEGSRISELQIAFYDRYVRGQPGVKLPRVRYFVMGANEWREAETWPPPGTQVQRWYLHSRRGANTSSGDGALLVEAPGAESPDTFVYDPHRPVPTAGGALIGALGEPGILPGPIEQSHVERRPDVLCYTTPPFSQAVEVSGPLRVHLFASTSAPNTDFTAKLVHVYPDGQAYNLSEGILRLSGRDVDSSSPPVVPGDVYELDITLGHTSQLLRPGERLRLDISSSNFPQFDRNMNTGHAIGSDAAGIRALQVVHHASDAASYVEIPIQQ